MATTELLPARSRQRLAGPLGLLIGLAALAYAGRGLALPALVEVLAISPAGLALAVAGVVGVAVTKTARWGALYGPAGPRPPFRELLAVLMASQMVNVMLPVRLGELLRVGLLRPAAATASTLVLEKALDLAAAGLIAGALVVLAVAPPWLREPAGALLLLGLTLLGGLFLLGRRGERLAQFLAGRLPAPWQPLLRSLRLLLSPLGTLAGSRALAPVLGWTLLVWLFSLLPMLALLAAFRLQLPVAAAVVLMLAVSVSNIAPSPPGLVGVMQGISVAVLGYYGVDRATALGFGIVLNLVAVVPLVLLGSWGCWSRAISVASLVRAGWAGRPAEEARR